MIRGRRSRFQITFESSLRLPASGTASEFAKALGVSRKTLHQWITVEKLPHYQVQGYKGCHYAAFVTNRIIDRFDFLLWAQRTGRYAGELYVKRPTQTVLV